MSMFKKAERKQAKLKMAVTGPSGSGKTYSSLLLASGIGKKIAVIDTENGSASLYADKFDFDTICLDAPYTVSKYIAAITAAYSEGYDVVVLDSITHAWAGDGGLLAKKEALDQRGGNSYTNWAGITKEHEQFKAAILSSPIHLIATMRSKQDYVVEVNQNGKSAPRKVGLAPIQRDGMEYEFTAVLDIGADHSAVASKDRTGLFDGMVEKITKQTGARLLTWLNTGSPTPKVEAPTVEITKPQVVAVKVADPVAKVQEVFPGAKVTSGPVVLPKPKQANGFGDKAPANQKPSHAQLSALFASLKSCGWSESVFRQYLKETTGLSSTREMNQEQFQQAMHDIQTMPPALFEPEQSVSLTVDNAQIASENKTRMENRGANPQ